MTTRHVAALGVVVIAAAVAATAWAVSTDSTTVDDLLTDLDLKAADENLITASGFIEARRVRVASEVGGAVNSVAVADGDMVAPGDVLVVLESDTLAARRRQAQAGVEAARAQLARLTAGSRSEEVRQAEAAVAEAEAAAEGARKAFEAAQGAREDPRQLDLEVGAAASAVAVAVEGVRAAEAQSKGAQGDEAQRQAALAVDEAAARLDGARAMLVHLEGVRSAPLELIAAADAARAQHRVARATAAGAAARLGLVKAGPAAHEVRLAEAAVKQAEARLKTLEVQLDKLTLVAPMAGTVTDVAVKPGERAVTGATLLGIAARAPLEITVYVAEADVGSLAPGTAATVRVDARPDEVFPGRVVHVASEAEFTPRDVKTKQDRASLVFGVRIRLATDDEALKAGMPADVEIVKD